MADFQNIILDHLNIGVTDIVRSISFYQAALAPLGIEKFFDGAEFDSTKPQAYLDSLRIKSIKA